MINVLVSACLLGVDCRYDGKNCFNEDILKLKDKCNLIPICPEQMGGLATPRVPAEIVDGKLINKEGKDVTNQYNKGREIALKVANINNCKYAILKQKSPSCGYGVIYDGSFSGKLIDGNGHTAKLLVENGIKVYADNNIKEFIDELKL